MGTIKKSELPAIGSPLNGGYFAGLNRINGELFTIITAPKALGQYPKKIAWGNFGEKSAAKSRNDGLANTQAMAAEGSKVAQWALGLEIDGRNDWFIPAPDEREVEYRAYKPTAQPNWCGYRDGDNANSEPVGEIYTEEFPTQTTAEIFQAGNAEAFDEDWYYTSTQYSAHGAYVQHFSDGNQYYYLKAIGRCVRAVRRDLVIE